MPEFQKWGVNEQKEFGAYVQLNPTVFKPQLDGTLRVEKADPRVEFFGKEKIDRLVETAGPKTRPFWETVAEMLPKQQAIFDNSSDIAADAIRKAASPEQGLNLTNKPTFSV